MVDILQQFLRLWISWMLTIYDGLREVADGARFQYWCTIGSLLFSLALMYVAFLFIIIKAFKKEDKIEAQ